MKPGSLVECQKSLKSFKADFMSCASVAVNKGDILTVRAITECSKTKKPLLLFEEFKNPIHIHKGTEMGYEMEFFKELQLPPSFEKELEEVILASECIC